MPAISYAEFERMDLRVAKITAAEPIPGKTKVMRGIINLGGDDARNVIIGGADHYMPVDMVGKKVVVVANLEPKTLAGIESNAMLLAADVGDKPFWLAVSDDVPSGTRVR